MEKLKPFEHVLQVEERNLIFVRLDTLEPPTLAEHHAEIAAVMLASSVPEDVRSYFATIQNLCLYGWFAYDLYAVVEFLCLTATEMALRRRLPHTGKGTDKRGLSNLMQQANKQTFIKEKAFAHIREIRQNQAKMLRMYRQMKGPRPKRVKTDYGKILGGVIPKLRNAFAHPRMHSIAVPGEALFQLRLTGEFINQLFAP